MTNDNYDTAVAALAVDALALIAQHGDALSKEYARATLDLIEACTERPFGDMTSADASTIVAPAAKCIAAEAQAVKRLRQMAMALSCGFDPDHVGDDQWENLATHAKKLVVRSALHSTDEARTHVLEDDCRRALRIADALTLETQTVEEAMTDLVRIVHETREQRDTAEARVRELEEKLDAHNNRSTEMVNTAIASREIVEARVRELEADRAKAAVESGRAMDAWEAVYIEGARLAALGKRALRSLDATWNTMPTVAQQDEMVAIVRELHEMHKEET